MRISAYAVVTTLLTLLGLGGLLSLRVVGLYSHQALAVVLLLGFGWAVVSRIWLARKGRLYPGLLRGFRGRIAPPFEGEWLVLQGGPSPLQSHHVSAYNQRFALDLVRLDDGRIFTDGDGNASVHSWEQPLVAPISTSGIRTTARCPSRLGLTGACWRGMIG